jgi:hypothetical protein
MAANGATSHGFRQDDAPNKDLSSKFRFKLGQGYLLGALQRLRPISKLSKVSRSFLVPWI